MTHVSKVRKFSGRLALLALLAGVLVSAGCASSGSYKEPLNFNYNANTDYPAVGWRPWLL